MRVAPYGSWASPVRAEDLAEIPPPGAPLPVADGLYWVEVRPDEGGRNVLVHAARGGEPRDVTPPGFNVRTRVHEYGGGAYWLGDDSIFFSHYVDGRVYRQADREAEPRAITPEPPEPNSIRYADGVVTRDGHVIAVRESHGDEVVNDLVVFPADGSAPPRVLVSGHDFYAKPRPSPDGTRLAWLAWNHPELPFTATELWVAPFSDGAVGEAQRVAGAPREAIFQPSWAPDGRLHWISDATGWSNLYREGENLTPVDAELGYPAWSFDFSRYAFVDDGRIVVLVTRNGVTSLAVLDAESRALADVELPYTFYWPYVRVHGSRVAVVAAGPTQPATLFELDLATGERHVYRQLEAHVPAEMISQPVPLAVPIDGGTTHAFLYRPHNPEFRAPDGDKPPLIVQVHGGPTAMDPPAFFAETQFWTTRGFAWVDVNYGGSTGYGRRYQDRLDGEWGVVDVEDAIAVARYLVEQGEADPERLVITGGSAGGYTTLCALAFTDVFAAGMNHFGVVDLETFAQDTHKFEERYLDLLVGPYPERADLYRERSPVHRADEIRAPLLTFQGLDDRIVPPSQSEQLNEALDRNGVPYAYLAFEGEAHGFRKRENLLSVPMVSLSFLARVLRLEPADELQPLEIKNLS